MRYAAGDDIYREYPTNYYICRGSYKDSDFQDGKNVRVQNGFGSDAEWEFYYCNMENEWEKIECPPGQKLVYSDQDGLECELEEVEPIEAVFFDIQEVPADGAENGFMAGFKITGDELEEFNNTAGFPIYMVHSECWMGDDNERPGSTGKSTVMRTYVDEDGDGGFQDLYSVGTIPPRENVNNRTYSCIWGVNSPGWSSEFKDVNVYASTEVEPVQGRDSGKETKNYNFIRSKSSDTFGGLPRTGTWSKYKHEDSGGKEQREYIQGTEEYMIGGEVPYCPTNSRWESGDNPLDNIICG